MKNATKNLYHERMLTVLLHIQAHLDDELNLDSLAAMTFFSTVHFHRIFKGMTGETVIEHIRRIRLERAAMRLACGMSPVTDAAFDAGYETVESFSRAFKKMFGCPPSRYREKHFKNLATRLPRAVHYLPGDVRAGLDIAAMGGIEVEVRIETVKPKKVIFVRHTGPYEQCKTAWDTLCAWAGPKGLCRTDARYLGISHDDPQVTPPEKIRYDACITVGDDIQGEGPVGTQTIGGGRYAVTPHKGSYMEMESTYARLMGQWLPQSGQELRDDTPCFEMYLNDPEETPVEELLTDIYLPLK